MSRLFGPYSVTTTSVSSGVPAKARMVGQRPSMPVVTVTAPDFSISRRFIGSLPWM